MFHFALISIFLSIQLIFPYYKCLQKPINGLCPSGYWPAQVNYSGGFFGTDRTFELIYNENVNGDHKQICQYCPNVGCYIVKFLKSQLKNDQNLNKYRTTTTAASTTTTKSNADYYLDYMMNWEHEKNFFDDSLNVDNSLPVNLTKSTPKPKTKIQLDEEYSYYMSCDKWDKLPDPKDIVTYLDCVMIGELKKYYLFIYEPRFVKNNLPAVDCVDVDFLAWISNKTDLLGLELGFKMKTIPPFLFRYYQRIMRKTQYICIDGSGLTNNSIDFRDTERFASNKLSQVVFRSKSLNRARRPPKASDEHLAANFQSNEEISLCPFIVQHKPANITPNEDCQFSPGALPTTSDKVNKQNALDRCPFERHRNIKLEKDIVADENTSNSKNDHLNIPPSVLSACLLIVVLMLTFGIIIAFCAMNHKRLMLCQSRTSKRRAREAALAIELAEQAAKNAANAALEAQQNALRHPLYGRYGMIPSNMNGAFGPFGGPK